MKKLFILSFFIVLLTAGCTKESEKKKTVSAVRITGIHLNTYPVTNGGVPWDDPFLGSATGPDITWAIRGPENFDSGYMAQNADGTAIQFTNGLPINLNKPKDQYVIEFWDLDDLDASDFASEDDLMFSTAFTAWTSEADEERDALILYINNAEIVIDVDYLFE